MITIKVRTILTLKRILGDGEFEFTIPEGNTLRELLAQLIHQWGDEFASYVFNDDRTVVLPHIRLMVNGQDIAFLSGMDTILKEGDEILILPPASGG